MFARCFVLGSLFGNTQNKGFGFPTGLSTGTAAGTSGFGTGTGLGATSLGGFGGFNIQQTQQQQGKSLNFPANRGKIQIKWISVEQS